MGTLLTITAKVTPWSVFFVEFGLVSAPSIFSFLFEGRRVHDELKISGRNIPITATCSMNFVSYGFFSFYTTAFFSSVSKMVDSSLGSV